MGTKSGSGGGGNVHPWVKTAWPCLGLDVQVGRFKHEWTYRQQFPCSYQKEKTIL